MFPRAWLAPQLLILLLASVALLGSCSGPQLSAQERSLNDARTRQQRAQVAAHQAVEKLAPYTLAARYNPCSCECPPFEVFYEGQWHRVVLVGNEEVQEQVRRQAREPGQLWVLGKPTAKTRGEPGRQRFSVFQIEAVR